MKIAHHRVIGDKSRRKVSDIGGQREKRALMRSEYTLGFLVSVFGRDGYFKYCR